MADAIAHIINNKVQVTVLNQRAVVVPAGSGLLFPYLAATEAAAAEAASLVEPFAALAAAVDPASDNAPEVALSITDEAYAVLAELLKSGVLRNRGLIVVDADGVDLEVAADDGALILPPAVMGGLRVDTIDDPGFVLTIVDADGGVIFEIPEEPAANAESLSSRMSMVNSAKTYFTSRRPAILSVIFDDLNPTDAAVLDLLDGLSLKAGFALNCANVDADTIQLYREAYTRGHSILSHSMDATAMSSGATDLAVIEAKMADSKALLESYGFKISGWVTPSSVLHSSYFAALRKYYGYAYTYSSALGWDEAVDPTSLARKGIESLLDTDNGTYGGHNVDAVTDDMDAAAAAGHLRAYYCHGVPSTYYTNADLTPRPSVAEVTAILTHMAGLRDAGLAMILAPDEALEIYYRTPIV